MKSRRQRKRRSASIRKSCRGRILRGGEGRYTITSLDQAQRDVLEKAGLIDKTGTPTPKLDEYLNSENENHSSFQFKLYNEMYGLQVLDRDVFVPGCGYRRTTRLELTKRSPTGGAQIGKIIELSC